MNAHKEQRSNKKGILAVLKAKELLQNINESVKTLHFNEEYCSLPDIYNFSTGAVYEQRYKIYS